MNASARARATSGVSERDVREERKWEWRRETHAETLSRKLRYGGRRDSREGRAMSERGILLKIKFETKFGVRVIPAGSAS